MAIYHLSCKIIGRDAGRSAVASAAYRAGEKLTNEWDGETHDYTMKGGVVYSRILLPDYAPPEYADRGTLWNAVEAGESISNAQLAREIEVALPIELTRAEQIQLVNEYTQRNFIAWGMCADISVHDKNDGNPHTHILLTMRPMDGNGKWENKLEKVYLCKNAAGEEQGFTAAELAKAGDEWEKQLPYYKDGNVKNRPVYLTKTEAESGDEWREYSRVKGKKHPKQLKEHRLNPTIDLWNDRGNVELWREDWAKSCNAAFERLGISEKIDHRSYERQGIDKTPTVHMGPAATKMKNNGLNSEREAINKEALKRNSELEIIQKQIAVLERQLEAARAQRAAVVLGIDAAGGARSDAPVGLLKDIWSLYVQTDMQLQSLDDMREKEKEYRRMAAALGEKQSEYRSINKQLKSLRERFENTGAFRANERNGLTKQINELTQQRDKLKNSKITLPDGVALSFENIPSQIRAYKNAADNIADNLKRYPTAEEQQNRLVAYENEFAEKYKAAMELPDGAEIYDRYRAAINDAKIKILQRKDLTASSTDVLNKASGRLNGLTSDMLPPTKRTASSGNARAQYYNINLVIDLRNNIKVLNSPGYERWAKIYNLKQAAQTLVYLEENGLTDYDRLSAVSGDAENVFAEYSAGIKTLDQRLKDNSALQRYIRQYSRTRSVYKNYQKAGYSKYFKAEHEADISAHQAAKKYFDGLGIKKLPNIKDLRAEYAETLAEKKALYPLYNEAKEQYRNVTNAKNNIDAFLRVRLQLQAEQAGDAPASRNRAENRARRASGKHGRESNI
jgi:hypothetical protein